MPLSQFVLPSPSSAVSTSTLSAAAAAKSLQLCPTLCDPIDGSPPGFPVPGILQARVLEWVAIALSEYVLYACTKCGFKISVIAESNLLTPYEYPLSHQPFST